MHKIAFMPLYAPLIDGLDYVTRSVTMPVLSQSNADVSAKFATLHMFSFHVTLKHVRIAYERPCGV